MAAFVLVSWTSVDPDLWGHVRFGEDIVKGRAIPTTDGYSFTSDRAWVNHEWLAEVLTFLAFDLGGGVGLVVLKTTVVGSGLLLMLFAIQRAHGLDQVHRDALGWLALATTIPRFHPMRPQVFSVLLFAWLLHALVSADRGRRKALFTLPIVMALWANLHGGFIVGLGVCAIWIGVRLVQIDDTRVRIGLISLGVATLGATLVNPYGYGLWMFLWDTVGLSRPSISDWQPLLSLELPLIVPFVLTVIVTLGVMVRLGRQVDVAYALIALVLGVASFRVSRLDAFFAIAVFMLLVPLLGGGLRSSERPSQLPLSRNLRTAFGVLSAVIVIVGLGYAARGASCIEARGTPEPAVVEYFNAHQVRANVLTWFDWGQYTIWHLGPEIRVSMDGRRETVYSQELFDAHLRFYRGEPGASAFVDQLKPDYVWLPSSLPVLTSLRADGWTSVFTGPVSTLLAKEPQPVADLQPFVTDSVRCFPEP